LLIVMLGYGGWTTVLAPMNQVDAITPEIAPYFDTGKASLSWPAYGQSAVGTQAGGLFDHRGTTDPAPIASIAKVMTALMVLDKHPLGSGEAGPTLTLTQADVAIFDKYYLTDGSLAAVKAGEKISEYQALQAMLLPSANNFADTLAIWAYGSIKNYTAAANDYALTLGMSGSHFADASGFSPQTVSTAPDLIKLGQAAMNNPVVAEIVGQSSANIPVAGTVYNVNGMLGLGIGIVGIKTGNTDQAGGCMLVAMKHKVGSKNIVILSAVMGAKSLIPAMLDAKKLALSAKPNFVSMKLVSKGQSFGTYATRWGENSHAVAAQDMRAVVWKGSNVQLVPSLQSVKAPAEANATVGSVKATGLSLGSDPVAPLKLDDSLDRPGLTWRLSHLSFHLP
jgi:D-alanyl-D-alanine carboxypeptidase (penicillin-binding protein 5/6)